MKKRLIIFLCALVISGAVVFGFGVYLKYVVLQDQDMVQDQPAAAVPFLLLADSALRDAVLDVFIP